MTDQEKAELLFPLTSPEYALRQFQKLQAAKEYIKERNIDATDPDSAFKWTRGPVVLQGATK